MLYLLIDFSAAEAIALAAAVYYGKWQKAPLCSITALPAMSMFEERRNLRTTLPKDQHGATARSAKERADLSRGHIDQIRAILLDDDKGTKSDMPTVLDNSPN